MKRAAGVLLNISSLPGQYGIGGFSCNAERFVDFIAGLGFKVWQTLPITTTGGGDSPYSGVSAFAGNYLYIDLERTGGLLTDEELNSAKFYGQHYLTEYNYAREMKTRRLRLAYSRIDGNLQKKIDEFVKTHSGWLVDYAVYMTLKNRFNLLPWTKWDKSYRAYSPAIVAKVLKESFDEVNYYYFEQYLFFSQWAVIKKYANESGVEIFGDMPIYVNLDSADVWANAGQFCLDKDLKPTKVAGVPPDYFSENGQLWGNPIYDYKKMAGNGYLWWINRMKHAHTMYDIVRIDHFRGFVEYWAVSPDAETAKDGKWEKGPQKALFDAIKTAIPDMNIVAEDLGTIDEAVINFLKSLNLPGMHVMQFGFDGDDNNNHLPHTYDKSCVCYTGTHDNDTTLGWLLSLDSATREKALNYVNCSSAAGWASGGGYCRATLAFIRTALSSVADLAVIPMQDLCGYGSDTRMNIPGVGEGCWRYRTNYSALESIDRQTIHMLLKIFGRC